MEKKIVWWQKINIGYWVNLIFTFALKCAVELREKEEEEAA
jgi:hypothetical protein